MLPVTPKRLAAVYDMLRVFPPFSKWRLPPGSEVKFHVGRSKKYEALWWIDGDRHHIEITKPKHGHLVTLVASMAHEMLHVQQRLAGTETRAEHNAEFDRLKLRVCKALGFDPGQF